jgi:hypothetical protein
MHHAASQFGKPTGKGCIMQSYFNVPGKGKDKTPKVEIDYTFRKLINATYTPDELVILNKEANFLQEK